MWHVELGLVLGTKVFLVHLGNKKKNPALLERSINVFYI